MSSGVSLTRDLLSFVADGPEIVDMVLRPNGTVEDAVDALARVNAEHLAPRAYDIPAPGVWTWTTRGETVLINVLDTETASATVTEVARRLGALGIAGRLGLRPTRWNLSFEATVRQKYLIEARFRLGEPAERDDGYPWALNRGSYERVLAAGTEWCQRGSPAALPVYSQGMIGPFEVDPGEDLAARMRMSAGRAQLSIRQASETRAIASSPMHGAVVLVAAAHDATGETAPLGWWGSAYAELKAVIESIAPELTYGMVKHGVVSSAAVHMMSLRWDWPNRPGWKPENRDMGSVYLEEHEWAQDAFVLQCLGPGYASRIPDAPSYRIDTIDGDRTVLEHRTPETWFRRPFVPAGTFETEIETVQVPPVLAAARLELDPILLKDRWTLAPPASAEVD